MTPVKAPPTGGATVSSLARTLTGNELSPTEIDNSYEVGLAWISNSNLSTDGVMGNFVFCVQC